MTTTPYEDFIANKRRLVEDSGVIVEPDEIHGSLFGFQRALTVWALRKGRSAIFADTGLGKTRMQIEWARLLNVPTLILAPLAVTKQTVAEAAILGVEVRYAKHQGEVGPGITITNYERLDRFDPAAFKAVVLDESSILKAFSGTIKKALVSRFAATPYRLACTATPAPNDIEELCNHADFLGVMKPSEMRSTFFIADNRGQFMKYRLKRHAHTPFYRWLSSWAMAVKKPSDLGFADDGFELPGLEIKSHFVDTEWRPDDRLFSLDLRGVSESAQVRRATLADRVALTAELVAAEPWSQWLIWCGLNDESDALVKAIPDAVAIVGADSPDSKADRLSAFAAGDIRYLVTKAEIAGFGMNFQNCARMAFVGMGYSYEKYYQALRRCYRFGQQRVVEAHIVLSESERPILDAVLSKETEAERLSHGLITEVAEYERSELFAGTSAGDSYEPRRALSLPSWMGA